jgi:hypothetical protein
MVSTIVSRIHVAGIAMATKRAPGRSVWGAGESSGQMVTTSATRSAMVTENITVRGIGTLREPTEAYRKYERIIQAMKPL